MAYDKNVKRRRLKPLVELLLATAARVGELLELQWKDIDEGYLWLYKTKNGKARRLPLTTEMRAILERIPRHGSHVFLNKKTDKPYSRLERGFKRVLRDASISTAGDVVIHTLRHTAISRMMDAGIDPRTIMEISGHSSLAMLERYTHPREQRKIEALEAINRCQRDLDLNAKRTA